jgi:hypothetical protein
VTRSLLPLAAVLLATGCPGPGARPPGPVPEYERPVLAPWDAATPKDPFDDVEGEAVDDEPDAGPGEDATGEGTELE